MLFPGIIIFCLTIFTSLASLGIPYKKIKNTKLECFISSSDFEHDYLKTGNILLFSHATPQKNNWQIHCSDKEKLVVKIPVKFKYMLGFGPQIGWIAGYAGGGMKDVYLRFNKILPDQLYNLSGYYYGMRGGLGLFFLGSHGWGMINKHKTILYGLDYVYNFFKLRSDFEGVELTGRMLKLEFRKPTVQEMQDPLVKSYTLGG